MRIAVFSSSFPVLSETFIINQIIGLIKLGVEVDIITNVVSTDNVMHSSVKDFDLMSQVKSIGLGSQKNKFQRIILTALNVLSLLLKGNLKVSLTNLSNILFDKYLSIGQKLNLISALNKNKLVPYDNIICHFGDNGYYVCKLRDLGIISGPISTVFHGYEMSRYKTVNKCLPQYEKLFIEGDLMLPISELWKEELIKMGCAESKIKVHRMGIDVNDFDVLPLTSPLSSPLKVVQVGRLTEKKAILDSINAIVLASQEISIEFSIIGDGELFSQAKELITSLDASGYINLLGRQSRSVVKQYLDEADVFLLPSVRAKDGDMEGVPVSLMEAMSKGLLVVSTYHSGIPELIENGKSGFLVGESQVHELVDCFLKIVTLTEEEIQNIRVKARATCVEKYNNDVLNFELTKVL
ncbi:glycosyltransferase [Vibrio rumoiensis]|uniref:glycosyltransferase n=1 Tax=Vibrio rumoiensis TaxID=76258 RepID=UPI0037494DB0